MHTSGLLARGKPAATRADVCDFSIEYSHIYTNEQIGSEQINSVARLKKLARELDNNGSTYKLCVLVDDYSFKGHNFDYARLERWLEEEGAKPHLLALEAALIPCADEIMEYLQDKKLKKQLHNYITHKRYPCSLFIASWYLSRLGKLQNAPFACDAPRGLINILAERFRPFEDEATKIIAATPFNKCNGIIRNIYF